MAKHQSTKSPTLPFPASDLERVRLTIHAQNFIVYFSLQHSFFETGVFVTLVQFGAVKPLPIKPRDIARLIGVKPMLFSRAWDRLSERFALTADGWVLRPNQFISARVDPLPSERPSLRHLLSRLTAFWGRACVYCRLPVPRLAIEHIVPKARGGGDELTNLTLACRTCNSKKGTKTAAEFGHPHIHAQASRIQ